MSPPTAAPPEFPGGKRCAWCGGALYETEATGEPQRTDHIQGCKFFARASQTMRFAKELLHAVSEPTCRGAPRPVRRYLQKGAKNLSEAACAENPVNAIEGLARIYSAEYEKGGKTAGAAEMLMQACHALAQGQDPSPITAVP